MAVEFLHELNVPFFKVASADTSNIPYLEKTAKKGASSVHFILTHVSPSLQVSRFHTIKELNFSHDRTVLTMYRTSVRCSVLLHVLRSSHGDLHRDAVDGDHAPCLSDSEEAQLNVYFPAVHQHIPTLHGQRQPARHHCELLSLRTPVYCSTKFTISIIHQYCEWASQRFFWFQKTAINKSKTFNHVKNPRRTLSQFSVGRGFQKGFF